MAIERCRTAALGGHMARCEGCAHTVIAYNSCRNRHCPKCQGAAAREWLAEREAELLPVPYFHVVYTLPAQIADITFIWPRLTWPALARRHAAPWSRRISATSSTGRDMAAGCYAGGWTVWFVSRLFLGFFLRGFDSRSSGLSMLAIMPVATRV